MIQQAIALLHQIGLELTAEEIADIFWLAMQMGEAESASESESIQQIPLSELLLEEYEIPVDTSISPINSLPTTSEPHASLYSSPPPDPIPQSSSTPSSQPSSTPSSQPKPTRYSPPIPFETPAAPALRNPLALARAIRPLMRKVASRTETILDEEATARQIAEKNIWTPVLEPAPERWLELALVIEETSSFPIWQETITEFKKLLERHGAFRDVRTWRLNVDPNGSLYLLLGQGSATLNQRPRSPKELLDPAGRRLIILVSDCTSQMWRLGTIQNLLYLWASQNPVAVLQLLPERLWIRSALGTGFSVQFSAFTPGVPNTKLVIEDLPPWQEVNLSTALPLPVITLEPESLVQWARVVAGTGGIRTSGVLFDPALVAAMAEEMEQVSSPLSALELVKRFRETASPMARRLAGLMAAVPVTLPVVRLIQQTMLPESGQIHVAEVFMSGLLCPLTVDSVVAKSDSIAYEFQPGVRELLLDSIPISDTDEVLEQVSQFIARKAGLSIKSFTAFLSANKDWDETQRQQIAPFAQVTTQVLRRLGGEYAALAEQLEQGSQVVSDGSNLAEELEQGSQVVSDGSEVAATELPRLQTFEFDVATIAIETETTETETTPEIDLQLSNFEAETAQTETTPEIDLQPFNFEVAKIELKQTGLFRRKTELIIKRHQQRAYHFIEYLGNNVQLEMVAIPGGTFLMGSPETEERHRIKESPQHQVTIQPFFIGKYPITQAQWQAVASLPQINRKLNPALSDFKGANRPVECVSWYDAVEFCARLSELSKRPYRLPSEAEWEYACRAGTTTPFHFGETISTELANYRGTDWDIDGTVYKGAYGAGDRGEYREETTPVGSFEVANEFGLHDMHGNVWEWCADHWHSNYEGAPSDGSAWIEAEDNENENNYRLLRGGSWGNYPDVCCSAFRNAYDPGGRFFYDIGFRVVCAVAWT
ncbi:MAG TPA: formylglycine-generating enzyme family protein [Cyanobacteria bacterium UBA12227]|nr:formylglycine-generating enzyme family protein [Cyanobacteria bacterium UBA12227]HAX90386.1 formylglycine-generating enzyme family protein [Cyanobacteria bacterium UBA11370]HBY80041.1 formylglycine-generating enzyme family protein [Cyanobacteria bacterium UBA11148]